MIGKMEISNDFYQFRAKNGKEKLSRPIVFPRLFILRQSGSQSRSVYTPMNTLEV